MVQHRFKMGAPFWNSRMGLHRFKMGHIPNNTFTGQIPGANQDIEQQEVALQKQMHMSVAM